MAWYDVTGTVADWVMACAAVYGATQAHHIQNRHHKNVVYPEMLSIFQKHFRYSGS